MLCAAVFFSRQAQQHFPVFHTVLLTVTRTLLVAEGTRGFTAHAEAGCQHSRHLSQEQLVCKPLVGCPTPSQSVGRGVRWRVSSGSRVLVPGWTRLLVVRCTEAVRSHTIGHWPLGRKGRCRKDITAVFSKEFG